MLNKVQLIGRLGADPEVRRLENGVAVARINVATSEKYKDKEGNLQEITEWHSVVAWRFTAEFAEKYLHKGDLIYVEGKLSTRKWQADNGENRYTTEVKADNIQIMSKKSDSAGSGRPPMPSEKDAPEVPVRKPVEEPAMPGEGDDLPF